MTYTHRIRKLTATSLYWGLFVIDLEGNESEWPYVNISDRLDILLTIYKDVDFNKIEIVGLPCDDQSCSFPICSYCGKVTEPMKGSQVNV